jgi:hypothetical protein
VRRLAPSSVVATHPTRTPDYVGRVAKVMFAVLAFIANRGAPVGW